ncbi:MAG: nitrous oxide-stimulated promoter family protein [Duodenibacillus sp.]|nr:nitrous oxide-stimulated promoter family protein [Duodenibacillus sp.]
MARLARGGLKAEADTLRAMIGMHCRARHGGAPLCPECERLLAYALKRLACCPYGEGKPTCDKCKIHCYGPAMRESLRGVMRWAGPRLQWTHPLLAARHLWRSVAIEPPEKPRGARAAAPRKPEQN